MCAMWCEVECGVLACAALRAMHARADCVCVCWVCLFAVCGGVLLLGLVCFLWMGAGSIWLQAEAEHLDDSDKGGAGEARGDGGDVEQAIPPLLRRSELAPG